MYDMKYTFKSKLLILTLIHSGPASSCYWDELMILSDLMLLKCELMLLKCELMLLKSKINTKKSANIVLRNW